MRQAVIASEHPEIRVIEEKPWLLELWEPLKTKAPCPDKTLPYCCYFSTVIFYVGPRHILRQFSFLYKKPIGPYRYEKPGHRYEEWDRAETLLPWDTIFIWKEQKFLAGSGRVIWKENRWWMRHWARRERQIVNPEREAIIADLPSAEDLDAVAREEEIRERTS